MAAKEDARHGLETIAAESSETLSDDERRGSKQQKIIQETVSQESENEMLRRATIDSNCSSARAV